MNLSRIFKRNTPPPEKSAAGPIDELAALVTIGEDGMAEIIRDKLTKAHTVRVPECTWNRLRELSDLQVKDLNDQLLIVIAKFLHNASFDPSRYLSENYNSRNGCAR